VSAHTASAAHRTSRRANMVGSKVEVATRRVGNCQVCERDIKLYSLVSGEPKDDDLRMVHHGYERPGHGHIEGDCPGVGEQPYERSKAIVERMLSAAEVRLAHSQKYLHRLQVGEVTSITREEWDYAARANKPKTYVRSEMENWDWSEVLRKETRDTERAIDLWGSQVKHLRQRIAEWKLVPVRTIEEIVAVEQAKKAAREGEKAKKRAERDAKEAAKRAKKQALEDKRVAISRDLAEKFTALAAADDKPGARDLAYRAKKKYHSWIYYEADRLGIDDVLIRLGVAYRAAHNKKLYWT
jgi:hypothetical protein